jgi:hypothetical protein
VPIVVEEREESNMQFSVKSRQLGALWRLIVENRGEEASATRI